MVDIDYELRADEGIEVEELTPKRVDEILSPVVKEINEGPKTPELKNEDDAPLSELCKKIFPDINESLEAVALSSEEKEVFKVAISELVGKLSGQSEIEYLILDGIITQRLLDAAKKAEIKYVIGHRVAKLTNDDGITLKTFTELGIA